MRPILTAALAFALPALAQAQFTAQSPPAPAPMPGIAAPGTLTTPPAIGREVGELRDRIRDGRRTGELSKREAKRLRREAGMIDTLAARYGADGLSDSERRELDTRVEVERATAARQRLLDGE